MKVAKNKSSIKGWNIRLKVTDDEERKIKMEALKKGMGISEYIKQAAIESLPGNKISTQGK
ncbi:MAG: hypothetical protein QNJ54_30725 [Prochloraceae cyanobacterium]|nr:hypothetical protein [Prochloraceae cyanobacterium]